jgi:serine/threonine protein kinase
MLLHRDIKPENILINRRGHPVLIDFGSARFAASATMTMTSMVTHGYSPIEQYQTKGKMGPWTDIYALGAVMCRAISGEKPPVAADRLMRDDFIWLSSRGLAGLGESFLFAVDWSLRVRPEARPRRIAEWEPHLRKASQFESGSGVPPASKKDRMGKIPMPKEAVKGGGTPAPRSPHSRTRVSQAGMPEAQMSSAPQKRKAHTLLIATAAFIMLATLLATGMVVQSREVEKRVAAARCCAAE